MFKFIFIVFLFRIINFYKQSIANLSMVKLKIIKFFKQFKLDLLLYSSNILPFRPLLLLLGILLFLYDFWFRYIRIRIPRDIPYDLSLFLLIILVLIILMFIIRIIMLLRYYYYEREAYQPYKKPPYKFLQLKPIDPRFLQNLYKIFTPFKVLDYYVRHNKYYKILIKIIVYSLNNGRLFKNYPFFPDRKRMFFKYFLWAYLPSWILLFVFLLDIFYFKKLELMYSFIPLTFIVVGGNYIWYSIKETFYLNKAEMNEKYLIEYLDEDRKERYEDNKNKEVFENYKQDKNFLEKSSILDVLEIVPNENGGEYARSVCNAYKCQCRSDWMDDDICSWDDHKVYLWDDIKNKIMEKYIIYLKENNPRWFQEALAEYRKIVENHTDERYIMLSEMEESAKLFQNWSCNDLHNNKNYVFIFPEERKKLEKEFTEEILPYQLILECLVDKYEYSVGEAVDLQTRRIKVILQISLSVLYMLGWLYVLIVSIPNFHITELEWRIIEKIPELIAQENDSNIELKVEEGEGIGQMIVLAIGLVIGIIKRKKIKESIGKWIKERKRRWISRKEKESKNPKYTAENIKETVKEMLEEYHDVVYAVMPLPEVLEASFKFYEENLPAEIWKEKEQTQVERIREEISKIGREIDDQEQQDEQEYDTILICCLCKLTMLIYSVTQRNKNLDKEYLLDLLRYNIDTQNVREMLDKEFFGELLEDYIETHKIKEKENVVKEVKDIESVVKELSNIKNPYLIIIGLISVIIVLIVASIAIQGIVS